MRGLTPIPQEERIQSGSFDKIPDGEYLITGFSKAITKDDKEEPCFAPSRSPLRNSVLEIAFEMRVAGGGEGPAASMSPAEFWMLVEALGGEVKGVNPRERTSSAAIQRAIDSVNANNTGIRVAASNGWVNKLYKYIRLPKGRYTVKFVDAHRPDRQLENPLHFQSSMNAFTKKEQFQLVFEFEVVGNSQGKPSLYEGYRIVQYMETAFAPEYVGFDKQVHKAVDEGRFIWKHTDAGGIVPQAENWIVFSQYFGPEINNHEWVVDPAQSVYGVCEVLEPQYVFVDYALKAQKPVVIYWQEKPRSKQGNMYFRWEDIPVDNEASFDVAEETQQPAKLDDLVQYIAKKWADRNVFEQSDPTSNAIVFTEEGRAWAKEYMLAPWTKAGLSAENRKPLHELTDVEVERLYNAFIQTYGTLNQESGW